MSNYRKLKMLLFEKMDVKNKKGRSHIEWMDDVV